MEIRVRKDRDSEELTINVEFPELDEKVIQYHANANMTVVAQGKIRTMLKGTKNIDPVSPKDLQKACDAVDWVKVFTPHQRKSNVEKAVDLVGQMSDAEKAALIASLTEK